MPKILESIAKKFDKKIQTDMLCFPNYAIVDHLTEGKVQQKIISGGYDYVIVQQGPSSQEEGRKMLVEDGKRLAILCQNYNTKLGYYMVWPSKRYYFTFDKVIANHKEAATKNNAMLFPVGNYWKQYEQFSSKTQLYGVDNFHPSKAGSFLAAIVIFNTIHPNENLKDLSHKKVRKWISDKESYGTIIQLLTKE